MTLRVATVLSARDWEHDLVSFAREEAAVRIVLRAFQPTDIADRRDDIDVVVAGAEVAWVTPALIASWRRLGLAVVGMYPAGDRPGADLLAAGGVDERLPDDVPAAAIVAAIRFVAPHEPAQVTEPIGTATAVLGDRGAPGCTEVALALAVSAASRSATVLVDMDLTSPALAIRLGISPRPDLADVADAVRSDGRLPADGVKSFGSHLDVIVGSHRPGEPPLAETLAEDVLEACLGSHRQVVVDLGAAGTDSHILKRADRAVVVIDSGAVGIVRAAQLLAAWSGPPPTLVANRVHPADRRQVVEAIRRWTGLEPAALVPDRPQIRRAALLARPPDRAVRRAVEAMQ